MNKILVVVYVPKIEMEYEVFIPINRKIGTIKKLIVQAIDELSNQNLNSYESLKLYENDTGNLLPNNIYVKNSNLSNGTKLVLI